MSLPSAHDPRVTLARPDLAEQALEGVLEAGQYRAVTPMQCVLPTTPVRDGADDAAVLIDQLAFGEIFDVLEISGGWAWGRSRRDGVVGHVAVEGLTEEVLEPTHRVASVDAPILDAPDDAPHAVLTLNALVSVLEVQGGFARVARLGWIALAEVADFHAFDAEPAAVAERFVGAPFQPGGRDRTGLDAPALVQQALYACGLGCPRAADQQQTLGRAAAAETLMRGDLIFWPDHVAMMLDAERLIHADPDRGVAVETLADAVSRRDQPSACRRL
ncbi:C40 family peptidase [Brevundimonas sp. BAL450]|uniref:C40 family peptidase n=1 Tax=Brevundimonas TaxID=41275 RepID=UPI0018CB9C0A|nr:MULTISPECIES: NlpC/P60 family protein [Brevundimonas]MBG7615645.1 C40 family peptidase [Brevundimonas sp. BAL450]